MPKFMKMYFFAEVILIMQSTRGLGFQNRNFGGFFPGQEVQKTIVGQAWPWLSHNLGSKEEEVPL